MYSSKLIDQNPLLVLPDLAYALGLDEAVFLQQVHYWLNPNHNKNLIEGRYWVYNTYRQWQLQFRFWSEATIRRIVQKLEDLGVLDTFVTKNFQKTKYYTINYDRLTEITDAIPPMGDMEPVCQYAQPEHVDLPKPTDRSAQAARFRPYKTSTSHITENTNTKITSSSHLGSASVEVPIESLKEKKENLQFEQMVGEWNQIVQSKISDGGGALLTPKRRQGIENLSREVLNPAGISWKNYCTKLADCRYLMGENNLAFKATLDWALNPDNAVKVIEGAIYDKPLSPASGAPKVLESDDLEKVIRESLPEGTLVEPWMAVAKHLIGSLGQATFRSWFENVGLITVEEGEAVLLAGSSFKKDWILGHFKSEIERALSAVLPSVRTVTIRV